MTLVLTTPAVRLNIASVKTIEEWLSVVGVWRISRTMGTSNVNPQIHAILIPATRYAKPNAAMIRVFRFAPVTMGTNLTTRTGVFGMNTDVQPQPLVLLAVDQTPKEGNVWGSTVRAGLCCTIVK